jgi:hypothetical protein
MPDGGNAFQGLSAHQIFQRLCVMGEEWAEQDAAARLYEELENSRLAQLTLEVIAAERCSRVQAEQTAQASDEYQQHIRDMVEARRKANRLKVRWESAKMWVELMRSQNANRRAEMGLGGLVT